MAKRDEFRLDITANDQASGKIDEVAGKLEGLNAAATVSIDAEDNASETIDEVTQEVEALDGETAEAELTADDEASEVVGDVIEKVDEVDEAEASATLEAEDDTDAGIGEAEASIAGFDGETATGSLEAEDNTEDDVASALESLESVEGTFTATIETEGAEEAAASTGGIADSLGAIVGGKGLAALSAAGFLKIGQSAADAVLEIQGLATATGGTLDQTSRVKEAWELAGGNVDTLERNVIRANQKLRESPELASRLGIEITENMTPLDVFIAAVGRLNSGQLTANERLQLGTEIFGSRGVLMLDDLQVRVGDLDAAMAAVGDNEIITQDDVDAALELTEKWDEIQDATDALAREALPAISGAVSSIANLLDTWPMEKLIEGFEILGTNVSLIDAAISGPGLTSGAGNVGDIATEMERLAKELQDVFDTSDNMRPFAQAWQTLTQDLADGTLDTDEAKDAVEELADALGLEEDEVVAAAEAFVEGAAAASTMIDPQTLLAEAVAEHAAAVEDQIEVLDDQIEALEDSTEALFDQAGAYRDVVDATADAEDAVRKAEKAVDKYNEAAEEFGANSDEATDALRDVVDASQDVADAAVDQARAQAEAANTTLSESRALDITNGSLLAQARAMSGPARDAILQRISDLNGLPEETMTRIRAAIEAGDWATAQRIINETSAPRKLLLQAEMNQQALANVKAQRAALAAPQTMTLTAVPNFANAWAAIANLRAAAIISAALKNRATGDPFTSAGMFRVGEQGPEIVWLPDGARVDNATATADRDRNGWSGGGGNTYVSNMYVPAGTTAREALKATRRYGRTQAA